MPTPDAAAQSALAQHHAPAFFVWVDFVGDPLRATTFVRDFTFAGTGDTDLNGYTFLAFNGQFIRIGDVGNSDGGSDTLTVELSGLKSINAALMAEIDDTSKWRGRTVRLWMQVYDETGTSQQGGVIPYYTGYASSVKVTPSPSSQTITLEVENYAASFNQPSNRSYLGQKNYDAADNSAQATLAAANMGRGSASGGSGGGGGGNEFLLTHTVLA